VPRIIVVDDDRDFRTAVRLRLERAGYEAVDAIDGQDLFDQLGAEGEADLIILDVEMPGLSGMKVLESMAADPHLRSIPVLVATGRRDRATRDSCLQLGAQAFYVKPLSLRRLTADVAAYLS
jgi:DNA-binding response OmpR family regulator